MMSPAGLISELVGHLASLLMQLNRWRRALNAAASAGGVAAGLPELLNDFFLPDSDTEAAMALIETQWQAIVDEG